MNRIEQLLKVMAGKSAQKPMPFADIVQASGLPEAEVQQLLDIMFETLPKSVNCCKVIKGGLEQMLYWPTGVIVKHNPLDKHAQFKHWSITPPRRNEKKEPKTMSQACVRVGEKTYKILQYIAEHGQSGTTALAAYMGATPPAIISLMQPLRAKKLVIQDKVKSSGNRGQAGFSFAPGVTLDHFYHRNMAEEGIADTTKKPAADDQKVVPLFPVKPECIGDGLDSDSLPKREFGSQQVYIDCDGQLTIKLPGTVRMVFPHADTVKIKNLLQATNLEAFAG